jgi:hypothetical protein
MIPKGISHTSVQNPTYEFQKRNIASIQENIISIQLLTTVILAGHFYWFGRFVPSTGIFTWTAFVGILYFSFDGPVAKCLLVMHGGLSSNPKCYVYYFFMMISLGAWVQIWFS